MRGYRNESKAKARPFFLDICPYFFGHMYYAQRARSASLVFSHTSPLSQEPKNEKAMSLEPLGWKGKGEMADVVCSAETSQGDFEAGKLMAVRSWYMQSLADVDDDLQEGVLFALSLSVTVTLQ